MKLTKQQLKQIIMEELEVTLNEKTWAPTPPEGYERDVKAAQKRAATSTAMSKLKSRSSFADPTGKAGGPDVTGGVELAADTAAPAVTRAAKKAADIADTSISTAGPLAKGLGRTAARVLPGIGIAGGASAIRTALGDPQASTTQKLARAGSEIALGAGDLAVLAPKLAARTVGRGAARALTNPLVGAAYAGYEGGKALQGTLAKKGVIPDLGRTVGVTDIDWTPSGLKGAVTGGEQTGGTQVDPATMKSTSGQRLGPKGKVLPRARPVAPTSSPTRRNLVAKRDDNDEEEELTETNQYLKQIIEEELEKIFDEGKKASKTVGDPPYRERGSTESQAQQKAAGMALSARRGDTPVSKLKGAALDLYNGEITTKELRNLAKLGQKVKQHKSKEPKHLKSLPGHVTPAKD